MQAIVLKSDAGTRFHFGSNSNIALGDTGALASVSEILHSDTLFSAIVNAWSMSSPETTEGFVTECKEGKFKLSSVFFYVYYKSKPIFFLPKPISLNLFSFDEPKKLKKLKYISKGIWERGLHPSEWFNENKCTLLQQGKFVAFKDEIDQPIKLFEVETAPKVRARNVSDREHSYYYQTDLFLYGNERYHVNWYFVLDNNLSENLRNDFDKAMKVMVNLGIGGERSSGCGSLKGYELIDFPIENKNSTFRSSLSLIAPHKGELTANSLYQIIKRGGHFFDGQSLPVIQMLLEGAVFDSVISGQIVELKTTPPVLRNGLNLDIPLHDNFINGLL